ncbi:MAG: hypothetical protein H6622_13675 [Halobacteriovoraceae bacterium]|nr:hypothetical protein [Halobacteriovoraceae bacterium]
MNNQKGVSEINNAMGNLDSITQSTLSIVKENEKCALSFNQSLEKIDNFSKSLDKFLGLDEQSNDSIVKKMAS